VSFLLDTNVVAEMRRSAPDRRVVTWFRDNADEAAYLSVMVIGEIRKGIERLRPRDAGRAAAIDSWLDQVVETYEQRLLPASVAVAQEWGRLLAVPQPPPPVDALMAATAKVHRLTLVTRNVKDVEGTGVAVINPFEQA
jgi:toxin FitB